MANYSAIKAVVNAYIKANGKKEITGHILNSVLNATIDSLGRYFQFAGGALPTDDPGTPDQNVCYLAGEPGVYTNFGGITIENEEVALLFWNGEWTKQRVLLGIQEVEASVDNQVGTPSVDVSYSGGQLVLTFHNLKGEQGAAAGFGTIAADINEGVGTPGVSVETSGSNTAKNIMFHFTNLKGETGVTSVVATIDDTSGTPSCQVSLVNGVLTLAFSGLKGLKGDTGVSADYPITLYNGLDSDATDQALTAAQGKVLDGKISQLGQEIGKNTIEINPVWESGKYYATNNIGSVPTQGTAASWTCAVFPVKKDEKYTITGRGGDSPRLWATADDDGKVLKYCSTGSSSVSITDYITIVEDGYLYVNMNYKGAGDGIWRTIGGQQAQIVLLQEKTDVTDIKLEKVARSVGIYEYSFEANSVEHSSSLDKYAISYTAGGEIRGRLSQGTAICDGTSVSVDLYDSNNVIKASKPITIGTDFDISVNVDCAYISFYIYRVTKTGTFLVSLEYLTLADAREEIEELKEDIKETKKMIDGEDSFSFTSASGEHSSTLDKHPINYSAGGIIRGTLSQGTGVCDGTSVSVNLYDSGNTLVARKDITIGTEFIVSAPNDASYISFYLYRVSVAGTFLVALNYGGFEERVENIEERFDSEFEQVPYYYDAMLATKKVSIRSAMLDAGKNGSTFVFITDVHWSNNEKHSPALIGSLLRNLPIENVFYGGDTFNGGAVETQVGYLEDFGKRMHNVASRFFSVYGNHDANYNDGGEGFDGDYFYTMLMKYADYQVVSGDYDNYYFDNPTTKTRFIVLNTGTGGNYYTAEQSSWLSSILSGMGDGYHAIIFLHIAYLTATDLANDTMTPLMASVASVADSFNSLNNGKKVEAFISGHLHDDANKTTTGGIPIILTDCDTRQTSSGNPQTAGTVNEQAFDVITINYSGTITCVRIGRGSDRTITY